MTSRRRKNAWICVFALAAALTALFVFTPFNQAIGASGQVYVKQAIFKTSSVSYTVTAPIYVAEPIMVTQTGIYWNKQWIMNDEAGTDVKIIYTQSGLNIVLNNPPETLPGGKYVFYAYSPAAGNYVVRLRCLNEPKAVYVNGSSLSSWGWDKATRRLSIVVPIHSVSKVEVYLTSAALPVTTLIPTFFLNTYQTYGLALIMVFFAAALYIRTEKFIIPLIVILIGMPLLATIAPPETHVFIFVLLSLAIAALIYKVFAER